MSVRFVLVAALFAFIIFVRPTSGVVAPTSLFRLSNTDQKNLTVGFVGDMVPSIDSDYNRNVFKDVKPVLEQPDLMIGNLEGTFASPERISKCEDTKENCFAFRGNPNFAHYLKDAGFDFVSLVNNHSYDFGKDGLGDTITILDEYGIGYITTENPSVSLNVQGYNVGILGLSSTRPRSTITDYDFISREVSKLKSHNDFVIVIFHGGAEGSDKSAVPGANEYVGNEDRGNVELVAKTAIDNGADLVLGAGPHILRKIDIYKNVPIAYSMGNFVGSKKLVTIGDLKLSGIFTATLQKNKMTDYDFISILMSPDGIPSFDYSNEAKYFIEGLLDR